MSVSHSNLGVPPDYPAFLPGPTAQCPHTSSTEATGALNRVRVVLTDTVRRPTKWTHELWVTDYLSTIRLTDFPTSRVALKEAALRRGLPPREAPPLSRFAIEPRSRSCEAFADAASCPWTLPTGKRRSTTWSRLSENMSAITILGKMARRLSRLSERESSIWPAAA